MGCAASQTRVRNGLPASALVPISPSLSMTVRRLRVLLLSAVLGVGIGARSCGQRRPAGADQNRGRRADHRKRCEFRRRIAQWRRDGRPRHQCCGRAPRATGSALKSATMPAIRNRAKPSPIEFVADHVAFVVGHFNSGVTLMASSIYADNGILEITPSSANPQITERGLDLLFRICGRDDQQAQVAAAYLASLGKTKIAILHDRTTYGKGLADLTRKDLAARGVSDVLYFGVNKDETDYSSLIAKLKASGAGIFYWGGSAAQAVAILKALRDQSLTIPMLASDAVASEDVAAQGGDAVLGSLVTFPSRCARSARSRESRAAIQGERNRSRRLYALRLCRRSGDRSGGRGRAFARSQRDGEANAFGHDLPHRPGRAFFRRKGRYHSSRLQHLRLEKGRRRNNRFLSAVSLRRTFSRESKGPEKSAAANRRRSASCRSKMRCPSQ